MLSFFLLGLCASVQSVPVEEDFYWNLLKRTYSNGPDLPESTRGDVGEPLILTPFIEQNKLKEAREAARVNSTALLPHIDSYSGYFTVNKKHNGNLFFWYFPVSGRPVEETPWIIWLQGGPGTSSMYGLFNEIGPFTLTENGTLEEMKYSWGKNHSLLFIDSPVGTGFSFTDELGYATNQTTIGENLYDALQQFLTVFPELRRAPLTIGGESYAGKHIPSLGIQIHMHRSEEKPINLHGMAIGNGFIDPRSLLRYSYFVREIGQLDDQAADNLRKVEEETVKLIDDGKTEQASDNFFFILDLINWESGVSIYNFLEDGEDSDDLKYFFDRDEIRKAIHVGKTKFLTHSLVIYDFLKSDFMRSVKHWIEELVQHYPVMCYNGHLDIIVAYHPSVNSYNSFKLPGDTPLANATRHIWRHNLRAAGYWKKVGNFSDVMVRGAGHMVAISQPAAALGLISAFARGISLEEDTGLLVD